MELFKRGVLASVPVFVGAVMMYLSVSKRVIPEFEVFPAFGVMRQLTLQHLVGLVGSIVLGFGLWFLCLFWMGRHDR